LTDAQGCFVAVDVLDLPECLGIQQHRDACSAHRGSSALLFPMRRTAEPFCVYAVYAQSSGARPRTIRASGWPTSAGRRASCRAGSASPTVTFSSWQRALCTGKVRLPQPSTESKPYLRSDPTGPANGQRCSNRCSNPCAPSRPDADLDRLIKAGPNSKWAGADPHGGSEITLSRWSDRGFESRPGHPVLNSSRSAQLGTRWISAVTALFEAVMRDGTA